MFQTRSRPSDLGHRGAKIDGRTEVVVARLGFGRALARARSGPGRGFAKSDPRECPFSLTPRRAVKLQPLERIELLCKLG
ncbi:hypothetical protein R1flu_007441 [Riccia fluitans]|uniref:Uncharacterized protein n=1 Tax=Riccia fluitans TaxID=41844 RepID=A0ABD1Z303_9MARC